MKTIIFFLIYGFILAGTFSQTVYKIPFASKENKIELTVSNTSKISAEHINLSAVEYPNWIKIRQLNGEGNELLSNEEKVYTFSFDVDKLAPVNEEGTIKFNISAGEQKKGGLELWTKEIKIITSAPDKYELFQNYPNPFNPVTNISYQLPSDGKTSLKIYNILGQEILTLFDDIQAAGYHEVQFSGNSLSSGMYIYRLISQDEKTGEAFSSVKKMVLVK